MVDTTYPTAQDARTALYRKGYKLAWSAPGLPGRWVRPGRVPDVRAILRRGTSWVIVAYPSVDWLE